MTPLPVRRLRRAIQAEWTKLWSVPSTPWLLAAAVALTVAGSAGAVAAVDTSQCPTPSECFEDTTKLSLSGIWLGQAAVVVLAVQAMSSEYGTGTIGSTLAANPSRRTVLLAKAAAVTTVALVAGVLGVLGSLVPAGRSCPATGSRAPTGTSPCRSPTDRRCGQRSAPCCTSRSWRCSASASPPPSAAPRERSPAS